ncbi:gluconokinase [Kineosphaera limosa]|uniref:Gluconokinase n=1 Tax=Kineosphaera limosa NBRC 100340 TaxID=1184609 RepID=K6WWD0_9MICO|nr:gluconokinase [Kineosphaera limosa]NYE00197.1 gluconokinase [Kineosphaera limosa]GAB98146.1 gluconokinase [Kineosphaera limosa NBRC 100340]
MSSQQPPQAPYRAVVMGVAGSGKTSVGEALAARLGLPFEDADTFHPPANVAKMREGIPLTDADREPWLEIIGRWLVDHPDGAIVTCSALKRAYRDTLRRFVPEVPFLHPYGKASLVLERMSLRSATTDHFMPVTLLESQYATLEGLQDDEAGITLDLRRSVDELVDDSIAYLQGRRGHSHL